MRENRKAYLGIWAGGECATWMVYGWRLVFEHLHGVQGRYHLSRLVSSRCVLEGTARGCPDTRDRRRNKCQHMMDHAGTCSRVPRRHGTSRSRQIVRDVPSSTRTYIVIHAPKGFMSLVLLVMSHAARMECIAYDIHDSESEYRVQANKTTDWRHAPSSNQDMQETYNYSGDVCPSLHSMTFPPRVLCDPPR